MRGYSSITLPLFFAGGIYVSFLLPKFRETVAIAIKL